MISVSTNPFSTRFTAPGKIPYCFEDGFSIELLVDDWVGHKCRGQIVGPHGTGKTTLMWEVFRELKRRQLSPKANSKENKVEFIQLRQTAPARKSEPILLAETELILPPEFPAVIKLIDGFEQLSWLQRHRARLGGQRQNEGLLISTHQTQRLPTIFDSAQNVDRFPSIVSKLVGDDTRLDALQLRQTLDQKNGNIREALFELYDRWEESVDS